MPTSLTKSVSVQHTSFRTMRAPRGSEAGYLSMIGNQGKVGEDDEVPGPVGLPVFVLGIRLKALTSTSGILFRFSYWPKRRQKKKKKKKEKRKFNETISQTSSRSPAY
jgi:hypothetical protein